MNESIQAYNKTMESSDIPIVETLADEINKSLLGAESKVFYAFELTVKAQP